MTIFSLAFPHHAPAQTAPACDAQSQEFLNTRLSLWQERLHLEDWQLSVIPSHASELRPDTLGNIHWDAEKKTATVRVLDASEYTVPCHAARDDMELTVVHELIHLVLSRLRRGETNFSAEEHSVNQIAGALVAAERQSHLTEAAPPTKSIASR